MDKEIIKRIREGDEEAFAELYDKYAGYPLRTATAIAKDIASASDAVQETFIRVLRGIEFYDSGKPFKPWLYKILVNECNRAFRSRKKELSLSEHGESGLQVEVYDRHPYEEYEELYAAIKELDDINRIPIVLKYLSGFSESEIAKILDININTVKSRLFKGRRKLKKILEKSEERGGLGG